MNKEDLIYDLIVSNQEENRKRFKKIEKDVADILSIKNQILGGVAVLACVFSFLLDYIKSFFK